MTKLLIGLFVVVVVLIIVFLAVRNRRAADPDEFGSPRGPRGARDGRDWPDYDPRERSGRHPGRMARSGPRFQDDSPRRPAISRSHDDLRSRSHDGRRRGPDAAGYGGRADRGYPGSRDLGLDQQRSRSRRDSGPAYRPEAPAASRARPGRSKRSDDSADWPSTEWDKLSDVDYWAELASDKPLTTTAQPAPAARNGTGASEPRPAASSQAPARAPVASLPVRSQQPPAGRPQQTRSAQLAAAPVPVSPVPVSPAAPSNVVPLPAAARVSQDREPGRGPSRGPVNLDDDPLTSPTFPRITDDSRSYRTSRPSAPEQDPAPAHAAPAHAAPAHAAPAHYSAATQQFASYGPGSPSPVASRSLAPSPYADPLTAPGRYSGDGAPLAGGGFPAGGTSASSALPPTSGNPYGSYVSSAPSGGFPSAGPASHGGPGPQFGPDSYHHAGPARPDHALDGPASLNGHGNEQNGHGNGLNGHGNGAGGWYPQPGSHSAGGFADPGGFDAQSRGQLRDDGQPYPAGALPPADYTVVQPRQTGYGPDGYPAPPDPAPRSQDPYGPDSYGGYPGHRHRGR